MKYDIFINGGFANIPKQFKGDITLKESVKKELLATLDKDIKPSQEIHDGFTYHIKVVDGPLELKSVFDEHNLPELIRDFLHSVQQKDKGSN